MAAYNLLSAGARASLAPCAHWKEGGRRLISVPAGYKRGLPENLLFFGSAYSEPTLLKLAYAFEQLTKVRQPPQFLASLPHA